MTHQLDKKSQYKDPRAVAREKIAWIHKIHEVVPLEEAKQAELNRILQTTEQEFSRDQ